MVSTRIALIPETNDNRPMLRMTPRYITIHETANRNRGANAEMHRRFLANGGGSEGVSFHWAVDDTEAVQMIPESEVAWHAGDGYWGRGNQQSIGIETCVNADGNWEQTLSNLADLVVEIMARHKIPIENVVQHNHWSGKDCPHDLRVNGWDALIAAIKARIDPQPDPNAWHFLETDKWVINAPQAPILDFYKKNGAKEVFGLPLTGMTRDEDGVYRQLFENVLIESWPNGWAGHPGPYVRLGGLGQRYLAQKKA